MQRKLQEPQGTANALCKHFPKCVGGDELDRCSWLDYSVLQGEILLILKQNEIL